MDDQTYEHLAQWLPTDIVTVIENELLTLCRKEVTQKLARLIRTGIVYSDGYIQSMSETEVPRLRCTGGRCFIGWETCEVCGDIEHESVYSWTKQRFVLKGDEHRRQPSHNNKCTSW